VSSPSWRVSRDLDVEHLPARLEEHGIKVLGVLAMGFGGVFAVLPIGAVAWALVTEGWSDDLGVGLAMFLLPMALFVALCVWGYGEYVRCTTCTVDRFAVSYEWRTRRGTRTRNEPLTQFEGLRLVDKSDSDTGDEFEIVLEHRDPALNVVLYHATDWVGRAGRRRRYHEVLGVRTVGRQPTDGQR
jgi:hypothetical protein